MIERFQEIRNVGTFKDAKKIAQHTFNKITIVYGGNSQGKSTFCDIIKSLSRNITDYIEERKTVGTTGMPQVKISFGNGKYANYDNNKWTVSDNTPEAKNITIFDNEFVQDNVFTNSVIERRNKEHFTKFILGSDSITIEKELVKLKNEKDALDDANKKIDKQLVPLIGMEIKEFMEIPYKANIHDEDILALGYNENIKNLKDNLNNIEEIKKLPRPKEVSFSDSTIAIFKNINEVLVSSYNVSQNDIASHFNEHKKKFNVNSIELEDWISRGRQIQENDICPYCGAETNESALVGSYLILFCNDFVNFTNRVDCLKSIAFSDGIFLKLKLLLNENEKKADDIKTKIHAENAENLISKLREAKNKLEESLDLLENLINIKKELFLKKIDEKNINKYVSITPVDISEIEESFLGTNTQIVQYNICIENFVSIAENYFSQLSLESINNKIIEYECEYKRLNNIINRNKFNDIIVEYNENKNKSISKLDKIRKLKIEFNTTQSNFLEMFFADMDIFYKRLGSNNFKIEKNTNERGTDKVYTVKLFYRGEEIENEKIKFVLSDSDKRALALSIFLSKLKHTQKLKDNIIVLDDPITSFDNERMNLFIGILKEFNEANQIIILTHYRDFYRKLVDLLYAVQPSPSLLKIVFLPESNCFEKVDKQSDTLLMGDYESCLYTMTAFIQGKIHTYSSADARTLMQKYLQYKFYHEIRCRNLQYSELKDFIQLLKDNNLITDNDIYKRLNIKREEYNVDVHTFDTSTEDAKRNSIVDLQNLLFAI